MPSFSVEESLIIESRGACVVFIDKGVAGFVLESSDEALSDRVVPAIGLSTFDTTGQNSSWARIDHAGDAMPLHSGKVSITTLNQRGLDASCVQYGRLPKLMKGGRYSVGFAAAVAVGKYADHLPLQRQVTQMQREGLSIDSQTLWDQLFALSAHLLPAYEALQSRALSHPVVGADETTWRLMGTKGLRTTKRWQVWAVSSPDALFYRLDESRSAEAADALLQGYKGTVMCDGYSGYQALQKRGGDFTLAHCWAHARRKFFELEPTFPKEREQALALIKQLYDIDRSLKNKPPEQRLAGRQQRAGPVMKEIHRWALSQRALPQSPLGKAIAYLGKHWDGLSVFLTDPEVPLDNNQTERALRGVVVGRKNHYGSRSVRGTKVAVVMVSLVESAKLNGIDPGRYLKLAALEAIGARTLPLPHQLV